MDLIAPLLDFKPGEVLVNFMTGHILRFAEHPDPGVEGSFDRLFGPIDYRRRITNLDGQDREDELVCCYMEAIRTVGNFDYVCSALVLHPEKDRTHFHLIYATRNLKGVEVFKQVEKKAMKVMEAARGDAQKRGRVERTGQAELPFPNNVMYSGDHYENLRERYLCAARDRVDRLLTNRKQLMFDQAWVAALQFPLVWNSDVKAWILEWEKAGRVRVEGLAENERVPKPGKKHRLVLVDTPPGDIAS